MFSESRRPEVLDDVIGHSEVKIKLREYLESNFSGGVFMVGSPGIGKTTMALCAAKTYGFDPMEINASKMLRSFDDVDKIRHSFLSCVNIESFVRGDTKRKTCIILDEIDGSDPHAQVKIIEWIKDPNRVVPILLTGNDVPIIFKKNSEIVDIIRCFPPSVETLKQLFPDFDEEYKECKHDIRRLFNMSQYGKSYIIPTFALPPTGSPPEMIFLWKQKMFGLGDPLECLYDKSDISHSHQTMFQYNFDEKCGGKREAAPRRKKSNPDK